jgi:hypothetical protein
LALAIFACAPFFSFAPPPSSRIEFIAVRATHRLCLCVLRGEKNQHPIMGFLIIFMSTQIEITPEAKIYSREQIR